VVAKKQFKQFFFAFSELLARPPVKQIKPDDDMRISFFPQVF
jgi:hypothetical protein